MTLYLCTEYAPVVSVRAEDIRFVAVFEEYDEGQEMLKVGVCRFGRFETHQCREITSSEETVADYAQIHLNHRKR